MKHNRLISTAVMFILLGTTLPALAQKGEEEKGGGKAAPAEHQAQQKAQPQRAQQAQQKAQPQRAQPAQQKQQPQRAQQARQPARQQPQTVANNRGGGQYGRISNANYSSHFGQGHSFHMGNPQMIGGYNRFQYGGYTFGYNQGWPIGWGYNDNCYVVFVDGAYYMYDLNHPGIHITLSIF